MRALSIRQPYAELILRGIKTVELRSRSTRIVGERFYIYASKKWAVGSRQWAGKAWSDDLRVAAPPPPAWMIELAEQVRMIERGALALLPTGVIVGSAVIERVVQRSDVRGQKSDGVNLAGSSSSSLTSDLRPLTSIYEWHLVDVRRATGRLRKPRGHPQPVWFNPFDQAQRAPRRAH
jgi:hypothetical protein